MVGTDVIFEGGWRRRGGHRSCTQTRLSVITTVPKSFPNGDMTVAISSLPPDGLGTVVGRLAEDGGGTIWEVLTIQKGKPVGATLMKS
jgi:hypothetical protein